MIIIISHTLFMAKYKIYSILNKKIYVSLSRIIELSCKRSAEQVWNLQNIPRDSPDVTVPINLNSCARVGVARIGTNNLIPRNSCSPMIRYLNQCLMYDMMIHCTVGGPYGTVHASNNVQYPLRW